MALAAETLLSDAALRKSVTDAAKALVSSVYTSGAFAAAVEGLYLQITAGAPIRLKA